MNSSLAPFGPVVRNSLMTTPVADPDDAVLVAVGVLVEVPVAVGVFVGVPVLVAVAVLVGVPVSVSVAVSVTQKFEAEPLFRGLGAPAAKSLALLSLSVQLLPVLRAAVEAFSVDAAPVPSKQFAPETPVPYPTKSTTLASKGQPEPVSRMIVFTSATLPAPAAIAMLPVTSGVGRFVVPPLPAASWIR